MCGQRCCARCFVRQRDVEAASVEPAVDAIDDLIDPEPGKAGKRSAAGRKTVVGFQKMMTPTSHGSRFMTGQAGHQGIRARR